MKTRHRYPFFVAAASLLGAAGAEAQLPPIRALTTPEATSTPGPHTLLRGRVLGDGRVIVNDVSGRRVYMLDTSLTKETVIYDADSPGKLKYSWPEVTFAGPGDSTWLTDPPEQGFRVLSPEGQVVRRASFAVRTDIMAFGSSYAQTSLAPGGIVYFAEDMPSVQDAQGMRQDPDMMLLVRLNMNTRQRDTLGLLDFRTHARRVVDSAGPDHTRIIRTVFPAFEIADAMTFTSGGELAIVRAKDFHVDWLDAKGHWRSTPPVKWPWHTLSVAEIAKVREDAEAFLTSGHIISFGAAGTARPEATNLVGAVPPVEPAFVPAGAHPDRDGRIWLQLGTSFFGQVKSQPLFAIIDSSGQIVDRVSLPPDRSLAGFGPGGTVFAVAKVNGTGTIERYRLGASTKEH